MYISMSYSISEKLSVRIFLSCCYDTRMKEELCDWLAVGGAKGMSDETSVWGISEWVQMKCFSQLQRERGGGGRVVLAKV